MDLHGAHVCITGASRGIGAAMAREFAAKGARLTLVARSTGPLEALAGELGGAAVTADLLDPMAVDGLIAEVEAANGPLDVLVNNAGIEVNGWFHEMDTSAIRDVLRLDLEVPIVLTRAALDGMIDRDRGHLVYISSLAGTSGFPGLAVYGAAKAGLTNFVAALRMELDGTAIDTTVVAPGPVDTGMWDDIEGNDALGPVIERFQTLQLLPTVSPESVARSTVSAVAAGRRHVRSPLRLLPNHLVREAPNRIIELLLRGVPVGPTASGHERRG